MGIHLQHRTRLRVCNCVNARGNDRYPHFSFKRRIHGRSEDDVGVRVDFFADPVGRFIDFEQRHVRAARDVDKHAARALHRHVIQKRIRDGGFCGETCAVFAVTFAGAHHGFAHLAHDRTDVGKVEIDQTRDNHQVGNAADAGMKNLVRHGKGVRKRGLVVGYPEKVLVGNDNQRIDVLLHFLNAGFGDAHPVYALELERFGDHPDG